MNRPGASSASQPRSASRFSFERSPSILDLSVLSPAAATMPSARDLGIPVTMIGGWYDMSPPSMLADYQALRDGGQTVRLRVGAWHHSSQDLFRYSFRDALDWFGAHLLGRPAPS